MTSSLSFRTFFVWFFRAVIHIFFRNIQVVGEHHIPTSGPVIFVGNHQNQFLDGMMLLVSCHRDVSFLVAAKSMTRPLVGFFSRQLNSIPVARPQDSAVKGIGSVTMHSPTDPPLIITGSGTRFTEQFRAGDSIHIEGFESARIASIKSDSEMTLDSSFASPLVASESYSFKVFRKTDQSELYDAVWEALSHDKCIGIFPEGGSHDRPELLPLKAGVAIMALGARAKYDKDIQIVPCGLNYFSGHRFRSRVILEFGKPIVVTADDRVIAWQAKDPHRRREACNELLTDITEALHGVTITAPDYDTLETIYAIRRLYQPSNIKLAADQYLQLTRRFARAYANLKDNPRVVSIMEKVQAYTSTLASLGLKDYQVEGIAPGGQSGNTAAPIDGRELYRLALLRFGHALVMWIFALPGAILNLPIAIFAKRMAEKKAKEALKASNVKLTGRDVIASYKVLIGFVLLPIFYTIYSLIAYWYLGSVWAAMVVFFVLPFFSYATVRVGEEGVLELLQIRSLYTIKQSEDKLFALRAERDKLKNLIRDLVDQLGPEVEDQFEETRIINRDQFDAEPEKERLADKLDPRTQHYLTKRPARKPSVDVQIFDLPNS